MADRIKNGSLKSDMTNLVFISYALFMTLPVYIFLCLYWGEEIRVGFASEPPVLLRTLFYAVSIATFPITNLLRHIMLRLNQTMPGNTPSKSRYYTSVLVSYCLAQSMGIYGLVLYMLGDNLTTLYIFCLLAALAMFLYRPKYDEYLTIVAALQENRRNGN